MIRRRQNQQPIAQHALDFFRKETVANYPFEKPLPGRSRILAASYSSRGWSFRTSQPSGRRSRELSPEFELAPWEQVLSE
jgi:hypothetical protein